MAERVLVLAMTLIISVGTFTSVKSETALMQSMTQIQPPENCTKRLKLALESVKKSKCIRDVGAALKDLLKERDEHLMSCIWVPTSYRKDQRDHVKSSSLSDAGIFPGNFLGENTLAAISHGKQLELFADHEDETQMSMEEKVKWETDAATRMKAEAEKEAGMKILRFFRRISFTVRCRDLKARVDKYLLTEDMEEEMKIFETARVTDKMCGICKVSFESLLDQSMTKQDAVSDSFTIGKSNANPDFERKRKAYDLVGVDKMLKEKLFTPELQNDMRNQEENSEVPNHMNSQINPSYNSAGDKSSADINSKEGDGNSSEAQGKNDVAVYQRLFSYEPFKESEEKDDLTKEEFKKWRARELKRIKKEHIQSQEHEQKQQEYYSFRKLFKEEIKPKCKFMQEYIMKYELGNPHFRNTVYSDMQLEINHLLICMTEINNHMTRILVDRSWKTSQVLHELLGIMFRCYNVVHHYVDECYKTYTQRQEEQKIATASQVNLPSTENWEEGDDIEDVVEDPSVKIKSQEFRNRSRGRIHRH